MNTQRQIEARALIVSTIVNFIMATAGVVVFLLTKLQALFLDAVFSVIAFLSNIMAFIFGKISRKKTKRFPEGMYFLEPLYGLIKSLLIFYLLISSTVEVSIEAYQYFANGIGELFNLTPVLPYSITMVVLSFGLSYFNKKQNQKTHNSSTMLTAESKANLIDGIISAGVGLLIFILFFINKNSSLGFLCYTGDFFITIILVAVSLKTPIVLLVMSIRELAGLTSKDKEINEKIKQIINEITNNEIPENSNNIYKTGMLIKVIFIENNIAAEDLKKLKRTAQTKLQQKFEGALVDFVKI